ncbi:hypothetical protein BDFB_013902 [Asbolus verrucosus]|uniref:CCHC-type domain-containing protein n=1 Tax=Asbolus verrucosus TaxID=1661398 RepID=A0A482V825_ASBVE|nr:hypothetical protein BDFB_013902 [Asbolus verrucosus]
MKSAVSTWKEALDALRHSYGENKQNFKIFKELFSKEQGDREPTDIFVNNCRALMSKLKGDYTKLLDVFKLDMVYGLLNLQIRKNIPRDKVTTFTALIAKARSAEENFLEKVEPRDNKQGNSGIKCRFCKNYGHIQRECKKFAASTNVKSTIEDKTWTPKAKQEQLTCYGCHTIGHISFQCPKLNAKGSDGNKDKHLGVLMTEENCDRPLLDVAIEA